MIEPGKSEELYRSVVEGQTELICRWLPDGTITFVNQAYADFFQRRREELIGTCFPPVSPAERERFDKHVATLGPDHPLGTVEHRVMGPEGDVRWLQWTDRAIFDNQGEIAAFQSVGRDVTDHRRAAEDLEYRLAFEGLLAEISTSFISLEADRLSEGINAALAEIGVFSDVDRSYVILLSSDGRTLARTYEWAAPGVERRMTEVVGAAVASLPGSMDRLLQCEEVFIPRVADIPPQHEADRQALESWGVKSLIAVPLILGSSIVGFVGFDWVRQVADWSDDYLRLLHMVGDILANALQRRRIADELNKAENRLLQAQKMEAIGRLAGGVAHDFNNLLTLILGFSEMAISRLEGQQTPDAELAEIKRAAERAAALTSQLLAFSRRQVQELKILDLNTIVTEVESLVRRLIGENIELVIELADDLGRVNADPAQIEQVIMNLAVNARDAMPDGGRLSLRTANAILDRRYAIEHEGADPGSYVMLALADSGTGIQDEVVPRIFEPFFTTKEPGKGTGLGLATVYGIVKQSKGYIEVRSDPGRGTEFRVFLPRVEGEAELAPRAVEAAVAQAGSETILLVEDDDAIRALIRRVLRDNGYQVVEAASGAEALDKAGEITVPIDLVLTDLVMPLMSGSELMGKLADLHPESRVLVMTGYSDSPGLSQRLAENGAALLLKPFTPTDLLLRVRRALDRRNDRRG